MVDTFNHLETKAINARKNIIKMITKAGSGHPGGSLSAVEIMTSLYFQEMDVTEENVTSNNRDKFVLSKGHAAPVLYAVLYEKGFITSEELSTFRQINSKIQGHPNMNYVDAIDMSTGSLGQGISAAVGMALSNKIHEQPHRVYTLLGDGELEEGQVWEAAMCAAHYKLDNLLAIVDFNGLQIDGDITKVMNPCPIDKKFEACGWNVLTVDGHNYKELFAAYETARETKGQPTVIIAKTIKGKGVSFMENQSEWHGMAPSAEQCETAMKELGGNE